MLVCPVWVSIFKISVTVFEVTQETQRQARISGKTLT